MPSTLGRPQENWERRAPSIALDLETISAMFAPFFAPRRAVTAHLLGGGLANTNYKVRLSGMRDWFALRLYTRDAAACRTEVELYQLVRERVPVPPIFYVEMDAARFGYPYTVGGWVEGTKLVDILVPRCADTAQERDQDQDQEREIEGAGYATGATLAAIGTFTFSATGFFGPRLEIAEPMGGPASFLCYLEQGLFHGRVGQRLGEELTERLWRFATTHAPLLETTTEARSLVHGDYKATNLLLQRASAGHAGSHAEDRTEGDSNPWWMAAVLDWEFAFAGSPLFDIAILLRHDRALPPAFGAGFVRGYTAAGGTLPPGWRRLARLLDLLNLCGFLDLPGERETLTRDATRLIVETIDGWDDEQP
jgi:aminoglycoside phosphotransferase (APT) family kinase protein